MAQLGELDAKGRARAQALARSIAGDAVVSSQRNLCAVDGSYAVSVELGKVRLERSERKMYPKCRGGT